MVERENNIKEEPWDYWFVIITNPLETEALSLKPYNRPSFV